MTYFVLQKQTRKGIRELETDSEKIRDRAIKRGYVLQVEEKPKKKKKGGKVDGNTQES